MAASFRSGCGIVAAAGLFYASSALGQASTDIFGSGSNQFTIDFVTIPGDSGDLGNWPAGSNYTFTGVNRSDYRIGVYEITNDQWNKFKAELGVPVTGTPSSAYNSDSLWTDTNIPTNRASWYEAAQFVNWLNTSTGHHPAYIFTGTQGTGNYALGTWSAAEAAGGTNLYRHKDAFYFLPTEDEWVKAAYWNGSSLQTYANASTGDLVSGSPDPTKWKYSSSGGSVWEVGSGSEELNGTFDMMGNVWEWMESPYSDTSYGPGSNRPLRGGSYLNSDNILASSHVLIARPTHESADVGFRVAAAIPEPTSLSLPALGGLALLRRRPS